MRRNGTLNPGRRAAAARRLRDVLRPEILSQVQPGRRLPSEEHIAQRYGVSRNAVRDCLALLQAEGAIERVQGAGTFLTMDKMVSDLSEARSFDQMSGAHHKVLELHQVPAARVVTKALGLESGQDVVMIERLTVVSGTPVALWTSYVPTDVAAPLIEGTVSLAGDYYQALEDCLGQPVRGAQIVTEAVSSVGDVCDLLQLPQGAPLIRFQRTVYDISERPVDFGFGLIRGDHVAYHSWQSRPGRECPN